MILSRAWYVLLGLAVAVALYVVYVAVGQYNRASTHAMKEGLASDSQTVEWALKIDARRRIDALLVGSVDAALQQSLSPSRTDPKTPKSPKRRSNRRARPSARSTTPFLSTGATTPSSPVIATEGSSRRWASILWRATTISSSAATRP